MTATLDDRIKLVKAEYLELPGLNLTKRQMQRLWSIDSKTCDEIVAALESAHFLTRAPHGTYVLARMLDVA
jgi:hypothetical protein